MSSDDHNGQDQEVKTALASADRRKKALGQWISITRFCAVRAAIRLGQIMMNYQVCVVKILRPDICEGPGSASQTAEQLSDMLSEIHRRQGAPLQVRKFQTILRVSSSADIAWDFPVAIESVTGRIICIVFSSEKIGATPVQQAQTDGKNFWTFAFRGTASGKNFTVNPPQNLKFPEVPFILQLKLTKTDIQSPRKTWFKVRIKHGSKFM
ncbi:hypothetical protein BDN72DRAFT_865441 [Pluteus cervinus]|uniref:Uncharacterized protein n=1 Tax=Pluteus cervinus TaxID=181527 RepID=A0ACD3A0B3_9AGAR|nr:hypothetical protein BDN72DRAFT_865441 [Pluteus cervinus]